MNHLSCRGIICRLGVTQLAVDIEDSLFLRLCRVFLQGVEDDGEVVLTFLVFMQQHGLGAGLKDDVNHVRSDLRLTLYHNLVTLDRRNLTGIFIDEILNGRFHNVTRQFTAHTSLERLTVHLYLFCQIEAVKDVLVGLKTDST